MSEPHERLAEARIAAGYKTASEAARALGVPPPSYLAHENGSRRLTASNAFSYAKQLGVSPSWLIYGSGSMSGEQEAADTLEELRRELGIGEATQRPVPNATIGESISSSRFKVPLLGQAAAGSAADGRFILNGQKVTYLLAPPSIEGVRGAYAVYVHSDSMEPRYYAGEVLFVNPHRPVRQGDFVVVQVRDESEDAPLGFVKQFVRRTSDDLVLEQFNPPSGMERELRFPLQDVISVHKVVASGEG